VVLAVEWGSGRRQGKLSNIHLGARDPATGGYVMLGKTFKGMTDAMLDWQTVRFRELAVGTTEGYVVTVRPEQVVEVAIDRGADDSATGTTRAPIWPTPSTPSAPCTAVKLTCGRVNREAPWHRST
jgi:ATP-dependent DNA ligase